MRHSLHGRLKRRAAFAVLASFGLDSVALAAPPPAPAARLGATLAPAPLTVPNPRPGPMPPPPAPVEAVAELQQAPLDATMVQHTYPAGWSLVSVPLAPADAAPSAVFDEVPPPLRLYDSVGGQSVPHGTAGFRNVAPGRAFWMLLASPVTVQVAGQPVSATSSFRLPIVPGWNAIATPWLFAVEWSDAGVSFQNGATTLQLGAAVAQGWIDGTLREPGASGGYGTLSPNGSGLLRPWRGYLLYSHVAGELIFAPPPPDTTAPTVELTSPAEEDEIATPAEIVGTADDSSLLSWVLEYSTSGSAFVPLATGSEPVLAAALGRIDPTLFENGIVLLRLTATDVSGNSASATRTVLLDGQNKLGAFRITVKDLEVPVAGIPIVINRTYDSRTRGLSGDFGFGWSLEVEGRARYVNNRKPGDGWVFTAGFLPCQGVGATKSHVTEIRLSDREVYRFALQVDRGGPVLGGCFGTARFVQKGGIPGASLAIVGNTEVFWQNGTNYVVELDTFEVFEPALVRLTTRGGRVFDVGLHNGLERVADSNGNTLTIRPDGVQHSSGNGVSFSRDAGGRITAITDPSGQAIAYAYDGAGNLQAVTDRETNTVSYEYLPGHFLRNVVDPLGKTPSRNEYDADGRLVAVVDASGARTELLADPEANTAAATDRVGGVTTQAYDAQGNLTEVSLPGGLTTRATYDERGNTLSETNPLGQTTSFTYDAGDNVLSETDAAGNVTHYTYDSHGRVLTETDPRGKLTTRSYDGRGNLLTLRDGSGSQTTFTYDASGNVLSQTDALGCEIRNEYDSAGRLMRQTDPLGHSTTYAYDANGRKLSETRTRTRAGAPETLVTQFSHDAEGRVVETTDPDGSKTRTVYDAAGRQSATIDKLGRRTSYTYNDSGQLVRTLHPDSTTEEIAYDPEGRKESLKDRAGRTTAFGYDAVDRLVQTLHADGTTASTTFDGGSRVLATTDERGQTTRYEYDAAGRRTKIKDTLGNESTFTHDGNGNEVSFKDARNQTTLHEYDEVNRRTRTVYPDGSDERVTYDAAGRRTAHTDQAGRTTRFGYDCLGRLTSVTDALGQITLYAYDEVGNLVSQTDAKGRTTTFEYDAMGRRTRRTLPSGELEAFGYDLAGNLASRTDFSGASVQHSYDLADRIVSRSYPDGSSVAFTYTQAGKRSSAVDGRGTTGYAYDERDRLVVLTYPDGRKLEYAYDEKGNRTSLNAVLGTTTLTQAFGYDAASRLTRVTDPQGRAYSVGYDANGNRTSLNYPNAVATSYAYSALNRLTSLSTRLGASVIQSYAFTLGPTGTRTRIDEHDGTSRVYAYDALYRLTRETVTGGTGPGYDDAFGYDAVGNRLTRTKVSGAGTSISNSGYDERDRLLLENAAAYGWDANGNLTSRSGPDAATYVWDLDGRLRRVTKLDGTIVEHAYDADGNRVQTRVTPATGPPAVTNYLVDSAGQLSQVVAETNAAGTLAAYYVRGDDLLSVIRPTGTRYYHADGLGSIRRLTDEAGTATDGYTFSAFGELLAHTGSDPNAYLFAGEPLDPNSGFYYNRARWLDPAAGRFTSMDPHPGSPFDPPTLHRYLYAADDPVNNMDPSGEFFVSVMLGGVINIMNRMQGIAVAIGGFAAINARIIAAQFYILQNAIRIASYAGYDRLQRMVAQAQTLYPRIKAGIHGHHVVPEYIVKALRAAGHTVPDHIAKWVVKIDSRYHQMITNAIRDEYGFGAKVFSKHPASLNELIRVLQEVYSKFPLDGV